MASFLKPHLYISTSNRSGYKTTLAEPNCTWRFSVLDIGWASGDSGFINVLNLLQYNPFIRIKRGVHVRSRRGPLLSPLLSIILFYLDSQGNLVLNFVNTKRIFTIFFFTWNSVLLNLDHERTAFYMESESLFLVLSLLF